MGSSAALLDHNYIAYNYARGKGGGVRMTAGTITNNEICYNTVGIENSGFGDGGGIYMNMNGNYKARNCLVYKNHAHNKGGGIYTWSSSYKTVITNFTIIGNTASIGQGICVHDSCNIKMVNSILWNDKNDEIHADEPLEISYCNIWGGWQGEGNIEANPLFVNAAESDFHLQYHSPCRDAGDNSAVNCLDDNESDPRIAYGTVDIGADEFYSHLYTTGDFNPGGLIQSNLIGLPGTDPTAVFIGSGVLDPPISHLWGNFYLESPWLVIPLVPIPSNGVLQISTRLPGNPAPYDIPMQALIGWELSNLFVLEVR